MYLFITVQFAIPWYFGSSAFMDSAAPVAPLRRWGARGSDAVLRRWSRLRLCCSVGLRSCYTNRSHPGVRLFLDHKSWPYWAILFFFECLPGGFLDIAVMGPQFMVGANHWYDIYSCRPGNSSMIPKPIHIDTLEWTWAQSGQTLERSWQKKTWQ